MDSFEHASSTAEAWRIMVDTGAATSVAPRSFAPDIELSPPPSTLQLTTATGKAIKTYGLRQVHLQSRGLSLEVSFVIADVVTPLLGLDVMIKESLGLHVEHDSQHVLVNPAGDKTQLEHMGRHLYMIACPSQHDLSPCFIGRLSQVLGFLPADKELHDQSLASRSSSSVDLDEDTSKHQEERASLNSQCQHVMPKAFDDSDGLSFDLMSSQEEVADSGGELYTTSILLYPQQPIQPFTQARELHNMTTIPFPWCVVPQEARDKASTKTSIIQLDYAYIKQSQDKEPTTILTWVESLTGRAGSLITPTKGPTTQQLTAVVTFITKQGFEQSILQCDGEPALVKLVEEIGKQTSLSTSQSPACNQRSEEWQSNLFAQFRALLLDFCSRHKLQPSDVHIGGSLSQHMLRHAEWLLNRFQLHSSDNKTSFHRRWGIDYSSSVLLFGGLVLSQDLSLAIWLGRCESSDEHILANASSNSLVKSTCVTRLSLGSSMELALFKSTSIPALKPASADLEMAGHGKKPLESSTGKER